VNPAPVLVPVAEMHVRRHVEPPWPEHATWCDFFRDPAEQRAVSASFRRQAFDSHLRLVRAFASDAPLGRKVSLSGREHGRGTLANLLMSLLERARLNRAEPGQVRSIAEQYAAIRAAADAIDAIELDAELPLSRFLRTYPPKLGEFIERLDERAPYVMACLVGRRHPDEPVMVLRAYLHPCAAKTWLLPVDSGHERGTLKQLLSLGRWLAAKRELRLEVEKPLFDLVADEGRRSSLISSPGRQAGVPLSSRRWAMTCRPTGNRKRACILRCLEPAAVRSCRNMTSVCPESGRRTRGTISSGAGASGRSATPPL
jgi:hypothetical protein